MVTHRTLKLAIAAFVVFGVPAVLANSGGPSPGYTGAPGEFTCRQCHSTNPLNDGVGSVTIEGVPETYALGATYTITVRVQHPDRRRWGFQLTALTGALDPAGSFTISDSVHTQLKTDDGKTYVEHRTAGTYAGTANGASWTVRWTAPAQSVGPVDFYAAGNAANNNGNDTGDNIYATFATAAAPVESPAFVDITGPSGLSSLGGGTAVAWADYDGDGDDDVLVARDDRDLLLENSGGSFTSVGQVLGIPDTGGTREAAWGDSNGDGRPDLALATASSVRLLVNTASGFVDQTPLLDLPDGPAAVVAWADFNRDGRVDLLAGFDTGAVLLRQEADGSFADATSDVGLPLLTGPRVAAFADANGDGLVDLALSTATGTMLYRQGPDGGFSDVTDVSGLALGSEPATDLAWADFNGDGRLDFFAATAGGVRLFQNAGAMEFIEATAATGLAGVTGYGLAVDDADGDGQIDVLVSETSGVRLKRYQSTGFIDSTESAGISSVAGTTATWADVDNDGHVDLLVAAADRITLWHNPSDTPWVAATLVDAAGRTLVGGSITMDEDGDFGAGVRRVRAMSGGGSTSQAPARALFGTSQPRTVTIRAAFPDGTGRDIVSSTGADRRIGIGEPNAMALIESVAVKKKNGVTKLQVSGSGFLTDSEQIEVDGVRMGATKYPMGHRLGDGTSDRITGTDDAFSSLVPRGREVVITTVVPSTGVRCVPVVFTRP